MPSTTPNVPSALSRRSFLKGSVLTAGAAAAGPALLTACGSGSGGGSGSDKVTYVSQIPLESLSMAPELLAVAGGYFKKHGLDVSLEVAKGTAQAIQLVASGTAMISRVGQVDLMAALTGSGGGAKQQLVNIGHEAILAAQRVVYSKKSYPVTKPQDMVGKKMGVPSEGGSSDRLISLVMSSSGLDPESVERQVVGLTPGTFNLVKQGKVIGYVVSTDTAIILQSKDPDAGVFDPNDFAKADGQAFVATRESLKDEGDRLKAFMAAIHESMSAMVADDDFSETIKVLRTKYSFPTLADDAIAKRALEWQRETWTGGDKDRPLLVTDEKLWSDSYKALVNAKLVEPGGDPSSWFDNGLLPKAQG